MHNKSRIWRKGLFRYISILLWITTILFTQETIYAEDDNEYDLSDDSYTYGTVSQVDDSSWGDRPAGTYGFTLYESKLEKLHFVTHTNNSLRVQVRDSDEYLLLDTYLSPTSSPEDFQLYLFPGDYSIDFFATSNDTSGDYKFKLTGITLQDSPIEAYCDQKYEGFFKSKGDGEKEIQRINLYTYDSTSNMILWSDTPMEWTIRDSDEKIMQTFYTQVNEMYNQEIILQGGSYILEIDSYNNPGAYSFILQSHNTDGEMQEDDESVVEYGEENQEEYIEYPDDTEQFEDIDRNVPNDGDGEEESGGITGWLMKNIFTPQTFIGAILVAVIASVIGDWLRK